MVNRNYRPHLLKRVCGAKNTRKVAGNGRGEIVVLSYTIEIDERLCRIAERVGEQRGDHRVRSGTRQRQARRDEARPWDLLTSAVIVPTSACQLSEPHSRYSHSVPAPRDCPARLHPAIVSNRKMGLFNRKKQEDPSSENKKEKGGWRRPASACAPHRPRNPGSDIMSQTRPLSSSGSRPGSRF
jgi:hypothetical protein